MASSTCSRLCTTNDELDAGIIFGAGFAPFRGGPIQYIRRIGADQVQARLKALAKKHGPRFAPKPGWNLLQWRATAGANELSSSITAVGATTPILPASV